MWDERRFVFLCRLSPLIAFAVGLAASSQAANQQYQGSLVIESFGNDALTPVPGIFTVFGIPQGIQCNPDQPRCPIASTPVTPTMGGGKVFAPLGMLCAPVAYFGVTAHPAKGATPTMGVARNVHYRNPGFFTPSGLPNATACSGTSTVSGGMATVFLTTNDPKRGPVMKGAPLTGEGIVTLIGAGPAGFKVKAAPLTPVEGPGPTGFGLRRTTLGEFDVAFPYLYSYTYATLRNDAGSFFAGGGPGSFDVKYYAGKNPVAQARVKAGPNKFGGVMRLLGRITTRGCYFRNGGCSPSKSGLDWRYDAVGAAPYTMGGVVTGGYIATSIVHHYHTQLMLEDTYILSGSRFPWTTGTASVTARYRGPHPTVELRKGYDHRTPQGVGTIQLVTPVITRWILPGFAYETAGVAILRLAFVPEPAKWLLLVAGLSTLGVLYRSRRR